MEMGDVEASGEEEDGRRQARERRRALKMRKRAKRKEGEMEEWQGDDNKGKYVVKKRG